MRDRCRAAYVWLDNVICDPFVCLFTIWYSQPTSRYKAIPCGAHVHQIAARLTTEPLDDPALSPSSHCSLRSPQKAKDMYNGRPYVRWCRCPLCGDLSEGRYAARHVRGLSPTTVRRPRQSFNLL